MRNSFATKFLSIAMMLVFPAAMLVAETGNTMLYASGNVMLNGKEVTRSASVAAGDKIETAGAAATTISQDGSKVTVTPYSAIRYAGSSVNVVKGSAAINTNDGLAAQAAQITVTPKDKTATYEIARLDNNVVITSRTGALMVTSAGKTTELADGASSSLPADPAPAAAPTPAPAPQAAPVFPGSGLSKKDAWIIAAVVGGASAATGLWAGMAAANVAPVNASMGAKGNAVLGHQGRAISHVLQVAAPLVNGVANSAKAGAQSRATGVQHRNIRANR